MDEAITVCRVGVLVVYGRGNYSLSSGLFVVYGRGHYSLSSEGVSGVWTRPLQSVEWGC